MFRIPIDGATYDGLLQWLGENHMRRHFIRIRFLF